MSLLLLRGAPYQLRIVSQSLQEFPLLLQNWDSAMIFWNWQTQRTLVHLDYLGKRSHYRVSWETPPSFVEYLPKLLLCRPRREYRSHRTWFCSSWRLQGHSSSYRLFSRAESTSASFSCVFFALYALPIQVAPRHLSSSSVWSEALIANFTLYFELESQPPAQSFVVSVNRLPKRYF